MEEKKTQVPSGTPESIAAKLMKKGLPVSIKALQAALAAVPCPVRRGVAAVRLARVRGVL